MEESESKEEDSRVTFFSNKRKEVDRNYGRLIRGSEKEGFILFSQIIDKENKEGGIMEKKRLCVLVLMAAVTIALSVSSVMAEPFSLFGRPGNILGNFTQGGSFSLLDKDKYDVEKGFNSALMNLLLEGDYAITDDLKFYGSGMLTVDWIYQLKHNDSSWHDKLFSESTNLNVDDKYWQLLKEAHFTWTPEHFFFRVGKQIVKWGEMDGFRLMDQINPSDARRGFQDVEFETSVIPIWLVRAEYYPKIQTSWLTDLGFEFVFNPNAKFISNQRGLTGNDAGGIWAPNALANGPFPFGQAHVGSMYENIKEPDEWKEGHEFAFRVKGVVYNSIVTLNAFYGRDNNPVLQTKPVPPKITMASDGRLILHPFVEGSYHYFRFVGATLSRDITPLKADFLGGVSPVARLEAFYAFDNTFLNKKNALFKSDEFRWAIGLDWKVNIPFLNPRTYFAISPQFLHQRIMDYPRVEMSSLKKNNYTATCGVSTSYFHNKLAPSVFYYRDINSKSDYWRLQLIYDPTQYLRFAFVTMFFHGDNKEDYKLFQLFDNKDQFYFKITYKWG